MKINLAGQRLRQNSSVHRKIIDTSGRRKTDKTKMVSSVLKTKDFWPKNGEKISKPEHIIQDLTKINRNSNIMVILS